VKRTTSAENKALVLEAFDTLFNKRDYLTAEGYWSANYIQHSAHIDPGREGLFRLIKSLPSTLKYEPGLIVAEGEFVIVHGRFSGHGRPRSWIAADILRIVDGVLAEHWDVIQDEASRAESKSGRPMFGNDFSESKSIKLPGPNHPITIEPNPARVTVTVAGRVIADTRNALTLREAGYAAVQYIPRQDVDMMLLKRTDHYTYCPYKGDCAYYSIPLGGKRSVNAVWTYEAPYAAIAAIKDHVAFYPDRVDAIEERSAA